jgi:hypothetical protein
MLHECGGAVGGYNNMDETSMETLIPLPPLSCPSDNHLPLELAGHLATSCSDKVHYADVKAVEYRLYSAFYPCAICCHPELLGYSSRG